MFQVEETNVHKNRDSPEKGKSLAALQYDRRGCLFAAYLQCAFQVAGVLVMNMNKNQIIAFLAIILLIGLTGYYFSTESPVNEKENTLEKQPASPKTTKTISIGTVSNDAVKQIKRFQPTADYIAAKLSDNETRYEGKVIVVKTVDNVTELLREQKLDLYVESPFATALVSRKSGSVPFLRRWKDGVDKYHSVLFVRKNSSINTLNDFKGKTIVFEDPGSTSGYMLPKAYLIQKGFNVSPFAGGNNITYVFSEDDVNIPLWITKKKADIGAISNVEFDALPESVKGELKVIDRTPDVPRHVVSYRSKMDPALVEQVKKILLDMDKDPEGLYILKEFQETKKYDEISQDEVFNSSRMLDILE